VRRIARLETLLSGSFGNGPGAETNILPRIADPFTGVALNGWITA
jgi:hypothetical protein